MQETNDILGLHGKVILITGANRGIGAATAELLAKAGATLILVARKPGSLDKLAESLQHKVMVQCFYVDVTDTAGITTLFQNVFKQFGKLDGLVNNAGILKDAFLGMVTADSINQVFATNVNGVIYFAQYAVKLMGRQKFGSIVNLSSIIGTNGNVGQVVYSASKAAVIGITKSLAKEVAAQGIRVNAIAPGFIDTDMARSITQDKFNERLQSIKMGRIGSPAEVAGVILFLLSDLSSYVTGQVIGVDGGMLI